MEDFSDPLNNIVVLGEEGMDGEELIPLMEEETLTVTSSLLCHHISHNTDVNSEATEDEQE